MVFVFLRISGKRQIGQMTPFDLVLLLLISNAVQNSMNGGDNSITAGLLLAITLIACDLFMGWLTRRSRKLETLIEGQAELLVHNGKVRADALRKAGITQHDLLLALRESDCANITEDPRNQRSHLRPYAEGTEGVLSRAHGPPLPCALFTACANFAPCP